MTRFGKPVVRVTRGAFPVLYRQPRCIVVAFAPGDLIQFREYGRRQTWALPVDVAFHHAVRLVALSKGRERTRRKASR